MGWVKKLEGRAGALDLKHLPGKERNIGIVLYNPGANLLLWIRTFELADTKTLRSDNRCGRRPRWRDGGI